MPFLKIRNIFILLAFIPASVFSQGIYKEGYIIRNSGNFIEGLVEFHPESKSQSVCVFKRFEIAEKEILDATEIKAFGFKNGMRYESLHIGGRYSFYETLVLGDLNLFRGKDGYVVQKSGKNPVLLNKGKIIVKEGEKQEEYSGPEEYLRHLTEQSGVEIKKELDFEKDLLPLVISHNQKSSLPYKKYDKLLTQKTGREKLTWMATMKRNSYCISAGINIYNLDISPESEIYVPEPGHVTNPTFGLFYERIISRRNDRLSVQTGLSWLRHSFYSYTETETEIGNLIRNDAFFNFSAVKIPLFLKYSLGGSTFIPYINGGFTGTYLLKKNYYHISETETPNHNIYTSEDNNMIFKKLEIGFSAGAGVKIGILNNMFIVVESRIESGNGIFDMEYPRPNSFRQRSLQPILLLGLQF